MEVKKEVEKINEECGKNEDVVMLVGDIKNMYTELPHREIVKVIE